LGHLGESHYLPLTEIKFGEEITPLYYNYAKIEFVKWARNMETKMIRKYLTHLRVKNTPYDEDEFINDKNDTLESLMKPANPKGVVARDSPLAEEFVDIVLDPTQDDNCVNYA
jgi:hypothetical protein